MKPESHWADAFVEAIVSGVVERISVVQPVEHQARVLSLAAAGAYLGRSKRAIEGLIYRGEIPSVRIGGRVQVDRRDLDKVIEQSKERAT